MVSVINTTGPAASLSVLFRLFWSLCRAFKAHNRCGAPDKRGLGRDIRVMSVCVGHRSVLSSRSFNSIPVWLRKIKQVTHEEARVVRHRRLKG